MISRTGQLALALTATLLAEPPAFGQQVADPGFKSVGRGAPLAEALPPFLPPGPPGSEPLTLEEALSLVETAQNFPMVGPLRFPLGPPNENASPVPPLEFGSAWNGDVPEGIEPLPVDFYTTKDFYADRELDRKSTRLNSSHVKISYAV